MITILDINEGSHFKSSNGRVFIIDEVGQFDPIINWTPIRTSLEGGSKGNYRDDIKTLVEILNEENCIKIN
jgi:hypothetical protein